METTSKLNLENPCIIFSNINTLQNKLEKLPELSEKGKFIDMESIQQNTLGVDGGGSRELLFKSRKLLCRINK